MEGKVNAIVKMRDGSSVPDEIIKFVGEFILLNKGMLDDQTDDPMDERKLEERNAEVWRRRPNPLGTD